MKRFVLLWSFLLIIQAAFAGGVLTNANQSAQYIRMLSRNASFDIDAVYFNPAGLIKLEDGWHFAAYNQTIFQEKTVDSSFPLLNDGNYKGTVEVPVFPTAFAVYKKDKLAFSLGFGPNSGGGCAEFERGLPAFEIPISQLKTGLQQLSPLFEAYQIPSVNGYDANLYFKGTSVFWGIQIGATYEINETFSVYGGVRYVPAKCTYQGHIKDITLETSAGPVGSSTYMSTINPVLTGTINTLQTLSENLQTAINGGVIDGNAIVSDPNLVQALGAFGYTNVSYLQALAIMSGTRNSLASLNNADVSNRIVDTEQTGNGFTPIIGLNFSPDEDWNIGLKYEMKTNLNLKNKPNEGSNYDLWDESVDRDIPAIFTAGIGYRGLDWLEAQLSYNLYFDKGVEWGENVNDLVIWGDVNETKVRNREIDNNYYELALGLQFNVSETFAFSIGGMRSKSGIAKSWQDDLNFSNSSYTIGGGIMWNITERLVLDAGVSNTFYQDDEVEFEYPGMPDMSGNPITSYTNTYGKSTLNLAVGISYSIF